MLTEFPGDIYHEERSNFRKLMKMTDNLIFEFGLDSGKKSAILGFV